MIHSHYKHSTSDVVPVPDVSSAIFNQVSVTPHLPICVKLSLGAILVLYSHTNDPTPIPPGPGTIPSQPTPLQVAEIGPGVLLINLIVPPAPLPAKLEA